MANLSPGQIVQADAEEIYIGNIYTVEADLKLPGVGKNGSQITWASGQPNIISSSGKVYRPREGAGNRKVTLTAEITFGEETLTRSFEATVLAVKADVKITRAIPVTETLPEGAAYTLPGVVITEKSDSTFSTSPVTWKSAPDFSVLPEGVHDIEGEPLANTDIIPRAAISIDSKKPVNKPAFTVSAKKCTYSSAKITGGILNKNRIRAEEFLISCNLDSMLYNFREAAGLPTRDAPPMSGWDAPECLLKGHTTGHFLSAAALAYAGETEHHAKFGEIISYMIDGLHECQEAMEKSGKFAYGFLSGYSEEQFDKLEEYVVYPKIWAPYYTLHKILSGLIDCYEYAKSAKALDIAAKVGTWIYNRLSKLPKEQLQKMWAMYIAGEFGGINESLARLSRLTGNPDYLAAAKLFDNEKLFYPMSQNVDTLGGIHGNQHVPQVIGALEIFARTGEDAYYNIARNFWHIVTSAHIYSIGGAGEGEMFQDPHVMGTKLSDKTAESCVSYNMLKLTSKLFEYQPKSEYMDYYEKTLLNHIAASQDQSGAIGGSTYFMPLGPGGQKQYDSRSNSCCHGTGLENHVKYQDALYYLQDKTVYVNLYIPSELSADGGGSLAITRDFLESGHKSLIEITREGFEELRLRIPCWHEKAFAIRLNGVKAEYVTESGYAIVRSNFAKGDTIELDFDFNLRIEAAKDAADIVSLFYGPLVMVALDDSEEFITLEKGFENKMQKTGELEFSLDGRRFIPNYFASAQRYHAYFKIRAGEQAE